MATVIAMQALDMLNIPAWTGTVGTYSATQIPISDGVSRSSIYYGNFSLNNNVLAGTGTGYSSFSDATYTNLAWSVTNASVAADVAQSYVTAGNISGFIQYVLVGNDSITGSASSDSLYGYDGNDVINAGAGNDAVLGGVGNDTLDGGTGTDTLTGGAGGDTYYVDNFGDNVVEGVNEGWDLVVSSISGYTIGANIEGLTLGAGVVGGTGNAMDNMITGNSGANNINGGTGADYMAGGAGGDTYYVDNFSDNVVEGVNEGWDLVTTSISGYTIGANIEGLTLGAGVVGGTGNAMDNMITGNSGANNINGGTGADHMAGGAGGDTYYVDSFGDNVVEGLNEGWDLVVSSISGYTIGANVEGLTLGTGVVGGTGNAMDNMITGNSGANNINGGAGADQMAGGAGGDTYYVDNFGDNVVEGLNEGWDMVISSISGYTIGANIEGLTLGAGVVGGTGNALSNMIIGNTGNNNINGGLGSDNLQGGLGNDNFIFNTALGASNIDTISDFSVANDTLVLENAIFTSLASTGALSAGNFVTGSAALDANDYIIYNSANGAFYYDADGNGAGAAVQFALANTSLSITNADFSII